MKKEIPNTTIIIGAGANKEIHPGIGLGTDLLREISERVTDKTSPSSPYLSNAFKTHLPHLDFETRFNFLQHLERFMKNPENSSIDAFIYEVNNYPEYEVYREKYNEITRVLIIAHVLGWEGTATADNIKNELKNQETWFSVLANYIEENDLFNTKYSLRILTFNYDRILEEFLRRRFHDKINDFIDKNIIHVYGRIGNIIGLNAKKLPSGSNENYVTFGHPNYDFKKITEIKEYISLIHDNVDEGELQKDIINADRILVFGYGFDFMNNKRLLFDNEMYSDKIAFNVYHGRVVDFDFSIRRKTIQYVQNLARKSSIKSLPAVDFLKWGLCQFRNEELFG